MLENSTRLLVLLRGVAFRSEGRGHFASDTQMYDEQLLALERIHAFVVMPARAAGWHPTISADLVMPDSMHTLWHNASAQAKIAVPDARILPRHQHAEQVANIQASLLHAARHLQSAGVLLLLRVDLVLKAPLPMPRPHEMSACVRVPFDMIECESSQQKYEQRLGLRSVSDAIIWVPAATAAVFTKAISSQQHTTNLHSLHTYGLNIELMLPGMHHETNTNSDWNPLFYIIGRPHASFESRQEKLIRNPERYSCNTTLIARRLR